MIIAIDGPAGSGKGTVAKRLAEILNFKYVETGALYRAIAYYFLKNNLNFENEEEIKKNLKNLKLEQVYQSKEVRTFLNGEDVSERIRQEDIGNIASKISRYKSIRDFLLEIQRELAKGNCVVEGRDIGTVVFPNADLKIFLTASLEERARRKYNQLKNQSKSYDEILRSLEMRDNSDFERDIAPLKPADDSVIIDTTNLEVEDVVKKILDLLNEKGIKT